MPRFGTRPGTKQQPKGLMRSASDPSSDVNINDIGFMFATSENKHKSLQYGDPLPADRRPRTPKSWKY